MNMCDIIDTILETLFGMFFFFIPMITHLESTCGFS